MTNYNPFKIINSKLERTIKTNTREKFNIYSSLIIPPVAATSLVYFGVLNGKPSEDSPIITSGKVALALLSNVPFLWVEMGISAGLSAISLMQLREKPYEANKPDSDIPEQTHFEHIPAQIYERNAERSKTLIDITRKADMFLL
ncbi:MAG: hypothetical protein AABX17_01580 [Nanoarchaeota archaeon]